MNFNYYIDNIFLLKKKLLIKYCNFKKIFVVKYFYCLSIVFEI